MTNKEIIKAGMSGFISGFIGGATGSFFAIGSAVAAQGMINKICPNPFRPLVEALAGIGIGLASVPVTLAVERAVEGHVEKFINLLGGGEDSETGDE